MIKKSSPLTRWELNFVGSSSSQLILHYLTDYKTVSAVDYEVYGQEKWHHKSKKYEKNKENEINEKNIMNWLKVVRVT